MSAIGATGGNSNVFSEMAIKAKEGAQQVSKAVEDAIDSIEPNSTEAKIAVGALTVAAGTAAVGFGFVNASNPLGWGAIAGGLAAAAWGSGQFAEGFEEAMQPINNALGGR